MNTISLKMFLNDERHMLGKTKKSPQIGTVTDKKSEIIPQNFDFWTLIHEETIPIP